MYPPPPIWLSEGFPDYVAYEATPVPTAIVASDVLDDVRDRKGPEELPQDDARRRLGEALAGLRFLPGG